MAWLAYTLAAAVFWGVGNVLAKRGLAKVSPLWNNIISWGLALIIMVPFALVGGVNWERAGVIWPLTLMTAFAYSGFYYVISQGEISLTGTVYSVYPIMTILWSRLVLGETTLVTQKMGIILTILGAIFIAWPKQSLGKIKFEDWVWWGSLGAVIIGTADFVAKLAIEKSDVYTFMFIHELVFGLALISLWLVDKGGRRIPKMGSRAWFPTVGGAGLLQLGVLAFFLAFAAGPASLVAPVSSIYQAITVVLAMVWLKEKVSLRQLTGIALAIGGVLLLAVKTGNVIR